MSKSSVIAVRIDPGTKERLEALYASFGLTVSDAINMFIHQSLNVGGLPFDLRSSGTLEVTDPMDDIRSRVAPVARRYGVRSIVLFGSRARGDNRDDSDFDLLLEMKVPGVNYTVPGLMADLRDALGAPVDAYYAGGMPKAFEKDAKRDGIVLYSDTDRVRRDRPRIDLSTL